MKKKSRNHAYIKWPPWVKRRHLMLILQHSQWFYSRLLQTHTYRYPAFIIIYFETMHNISEEVFIIHIKEVPCRVKFDKVEMIVIFFTRNMTFDVLRVCQHRFHRQALHCTDVFTHIIISYYRIYNIYI